MINTVLSMHLCAGAAGNTAVRTAWAYLSNC